MVAIIGVGQYNKEKEKVIKCSCGNILFTKALQMKGVCDDCMNDMSGKKRCK